MQTIAQVDAELQNQVVAQVYGRPVTRAELSAAFDRVSDKTNWKLPIDATVDVADDAEIAMIAEAVTFFAGCRARINYAGKQTRVHVQAVGYYAAVGA